MPTDVLAFKRLGLCSETKRTIGAEPVRAAGGPVDGAGGRLVLPSSRACSPAHLVTGHMTGHDPR
jgi:hypothetical protein